MKKKGKLRFSMAAGIIGGIVMLLVVFGLIVSLFGYVGFTNSIKSEYSSTTYHIADTAAQLINGDHLEEYLQGKETEEYQRTKSILDVYCKKINVSLIYVIVVDTSDYGRFVSVFNSVYNALDNSSYTAWELGHRRDTTNDEYRMKYRKMYEQTAQYETVYRIKTTDGQNPHITTMVPVLDSYNNTVAVLCVQRPISEIRSATGPYMIRVAVATVLLAILASALAAFFLRRYFVRPIRKVSNEAMRFAKDNTQGEPIGEISRFSEIANLASSIETMETDMLQYMDSLTDAAADKERIITELNTAKTIQGNSVPSVFPPFPDRKEFDIFAVMKPAREVGGDFYNFGFVDDDHLALMIGDVSGKGIPAALFMMVSNILLTYTTSVVKNPAEVLASVNNNLFEHNEADMFVTIWLGILELSTGKMIAANAGHEYPAVMSEGQYRLLKDPHGFVAAGLKDMEYTNYEILLKPGDRLFVYTDGVPEATNEAEELFGTRRMIDVLNLEPGAEPEKVLQNIQEGIDAFVGNAEQFDDLTMLCLKYNGKEGGNHDN